MFDTSSLIGPQKPHAIDLAESIEVNGYALDLSDTGTGKTYVAAAIARHFRTHLFVICPKAVFPSWRKVLAAFGISDYVLINYEKLGRGNTKWMKWKKMQDPEDPTNEKAKRELPFFKIRQDSLIILDEGHRCKGVDTSNSWMLVGLVQQGYRLLVSSATLASSPLEMKAVGYLCRLHKIHNFKNFCLEFGADWTGRFGAMTFNAQLERCKQAMLKLNNRLFEEIRCASRLRREQFGDLFPESQILPEAFDFGPNNPKIAAVYDEMEYELAKLEERAESYSDHIFAIIMEARRKVELLKASLFCDMIEDHFDEGKSVAVFCNFTETINAIVKRLSKLKKFAGQIALVIGGQKEVERQDFIDAFQSDRKRVVLCNIDAGGVGISLHDIGGIHPRTSIISPTWKANAMIQALGRVWRQGGKSKSLQYIAYASDCIEEQICLRVQGKITCLNTLNDADVAEDVRWLDTDQLAA